MCPPMNKELIIIITDIFIKLYSLQIHTSYSKTGESTRDRRKMRYEANVESTLKLETQNTHTHTHTHKHTHTHENRHPRSL